MGDTPSLPISKIEAEDRHANFYDARVNLDNGEAWLAEHFNAYLADPDEHRAILRHLLHLGGRVDYRPAGITVTLDRPDSPRVAHALRAAHRRAQRHPGAPARRSPTTALPTGQALNLDGDLVPTSEL